MNALILLLHLVHPATSFQPISPTAFSRNGASRWQKQNNRMLDNFLLSADTVDIETAAENNTTESQSQPICRIVTRADSKIPTSTSFLPTALFQRPELLTKLDDYYNAKAHRETKKLDYLYREKGSSLKRECLENNVIRKTSVEEEKQMVGVLRSSLEDAGFELLNRRDIDLCDSLNAEYLLRLSIVPDVSELDGSIAKDFYPERFHSNGTVLDEDELLFDGRVLVYWRGYSEEVTRGRLLLPKLDYLQASLVQRTAAKVKRRIDTVENVLARKILKTLKQWRQIAGDKVEKVADSVPVERVGSTIRKSLVDERDIEAAIFPQGKTGRIKLGRYGGSKVRFVGSPDQNDALEPFMICEIPINEQNATTVAAEHEMKDEVNHNKMTCAYDGELELAREKGEGTRMELLERVSINNLVNLFTKSGRRKILRAIFEKSELVEPTYEEVVVVWRPKPKKEIRTLRPPQWLSDLADMFDVEGFEQAPKDEEPEARKDIEIRNFEGVPMANLPAVLPKTRLIFRPADAFLFDMISFVTLLLVLGSVRLDSPRLDLLALVSVTLWTIRTVFRYSNKLARYDLLVKTFLTSKISHRNGGALKYITSEAGSQRALRSALTYYWISNFVGAIKAPFRWRIDKHYTRQSIIEKAQDGINDLLKTETQVQIHVKRSLKDLEKLKLLRFDRKDDETLKEVLDVESSYDTIKNNWISFFDEEEDDDSDSDGNTGPSSSTGVANPLVLVEEIIDPSIEQSQTKETNFETKPRSRSLNEQFVIHREKLRRSLEKPAEGCESESLYSWQKNLQSRRLQMVYGGLSPDGGNKSKRTTWYF